MDTMQQFYTCKTCGKYLPLAEMQSGGYCSAACLNVFGQCITCGRYVIREDLYKTHFCGPECSQQYTFLKTLGPRPVIISSDQTPNDFEPTSLL